MNTDKYKRFLLRFGYWAAIFAIVYVFFRYVFAFTLPFLIAFTVAVLLRPAVLFLFKKFKIPKGLSGLVLVIFVYLALAGLLFLITSQIIVGILELIKVMPSIFTSAVVPALSQLSTTLVALLTRFNVSAVNIVNDSMPQIITSIGGAVTDFSVYVVTWVSGVAVSIPEAILTAIICIIVSVYATVDYDQITGFFKTIFPKNVVSVTLAAGQSLKTILGNFTKSYLLIMLITFSEIAIGLLIIGQRWAVLIALIIAVFDILPIIGSGLILIPWTIITFILGDFKIGVSLAILYVFVTIVRQIIEPKIVGKQVGLHPLVTLFCMWMGAHLFGGIGLFGFPITVLIIKNLVESGVVGRHSDTAPTQPNGQQ
ncbi:sporulation integral membrane protein YtvI [Oscillospiraceae bacterium CM]|nr:sporulation integral membrane protein YtvI [Oscillospiraceae bacterium CM]